MMILLLSLITLLNLHGRLLRIFGIKDIFYQPSPDDVEVSEGKRVIAHARSMEQRNRERRFDSPVGSSRSKAREYLMGKYRGRELGSFDGGGLMGDDGGGVRGDDGGWAGTSPTGAGSSRVFGNEAGSIAGIWDSNPGYN
jgi:hypothetical protein